MHDFLCEDCKISTLHHGYLFILHDSVWLSIASKNTLLCFECAEKRLGRWITLDDLKHCTVNLPIRKGYEMSHRENVSSATSI